MNGIRQVLDETTELVNLVGVEVVDDKVDN